MNEPSWDIDKLAIYQTNSNMTNEERSVRNAPRHCNKPTQKLQEIWSIWVSFSGFDWWPNYNNFVLIKTVDK